MSDDAVTYQTLGKRLQRVLALSRLPALPGRVVLVTGGTDGVGRALVEQLATTGATVLFTARDRAKGDRVQTAVQRITENEEVHVVDLDLGDLGTVRSAAQSVLEQWDRLDVLICNAGQSAAKKRRVTTQGFEMTFGVNHVAHALLVQLLEDRLRSSAPSRIVVVASEAHRRARGGIDFDDLMMEQRYRPGLAYSRSKLANILFALEESRRLRGSGVDVNAVHPGGVDTPMMRSNFQKSLVQPVYRALRLVLLITADDAAAGVLRVALDPALAGTTGQYFEIGKVRAQGDTARDEVAMQKLWAATDELLGQAAPSA
jgi:NAD(P)-dependent dehydrogenase (short-subunit alcohol dehydrogenase family)